MNQEVIPVHSLNCCNNIYRLQRPLAPQGSTSPVSVTGRPISSDSTCPPCFGQIAVPIMYVRTAGASPVVYELIRKKRASSERSCSQSLTNGYIASSIFQISQIGPLPYEGGSIIIPS